MAPLSLLLGSPNPFVLHLSFSLQPKRLSLVSNPLIASMDPAPKANSQAKLVTECFEACPALEIPALKRSSTTSPDLKSVKRSECGGVEEPKVDKKEDHCREGNVAVVLFDERWGEGNVCLRGWLPSLAGHDGNIIAQGKQTSVVAGVSRLDLVGGCILPSLKELGLDVYLGKRSLE